jgi:hypothetical protein
MERRWIVMHALLPALLIGMTGCGDRSQASAGAGSAGVKQTGFPGQVTAGGGTSGEVIARAGQAKDAAYTGGTPGIAGGSGGNTGGPATGGTVQESGRGPAGGQAQGSPQ